MGFLKVALSVIYIIVCISLIIIALMQNSEDEGVSGAIVGGSSSSFFEKNKGRTKEGKLKKWTIILGVIFLVLNIIYSIVYML